MTTYLMAPYMKYERNNKYTIILDVDLARLTVSLAFGKKNEVEVRVVDITSSLSSFSVYEATKAPAPAIYHI